MGSHAMPPHPPGALHETVALHKAVHKTAYAVRGGLIVLCSSQSLCSGLIGLPRPLAAEATRRGGFLGLLLGAQRYGSVSAKWRQLLALMAQGECGHRLLALKFDGLL